MAKSSDIIKIGFDYRASLEQFVKETNGVFDGISEKAGKQRISIQLDAKNDKVIEKIKELQKLKLDKFTFEFGESGLAEQLKTFDQLEKKITEIINLSKGINNIGSGNGIGNSIVDEKSLNSIIDLFGKMESHLGEIKKIFADVGDGGEFSPLLSTIEKVNSSIKELNNNTKNIGLNMSIDVGSNKEMETKFQEKTSKALIAYQRLFEHIKSTTTSQLIFDKFNDFNLDNFDTTYSKAKAIADFIERARNDSKLLYNGHDVLKEDSATKYWNQASAAMGQATKVLNEMKASSDASPLENLFGKTDLTEVVTQLNLIVDKLGEISSTASEFKNTFANGFNVSASIEEIEKLTNRVKELEDELSKVKVSSTSPVETNISSGNSEDLKVVVDTLTKLSNLNGSISLGKIMTEAVKGTKIANEELLNILQTLRLVDKEGKVIAQHITEGTLNSGVELTDKFAIISRNDAIENLDLLIAKEKEAEEQGIILAKTLASVDVGKLHYDIQELAQGQSVHKMKDSSLENFIKETEILCKATDEQILKLYSDAQKLSDLGFKLDLNPSNLRYDEKSGFSFIDLELRKINEDAPETISIIHTLTQSLMGFMGQRSRLNWDDENSFYTQDNLSYLQNMLKIYERLKVVFSEKLDTPTFNNGFIDSYELVLSRLKELEKHFEELGVSSTPIKDTFQGDKIEQATTSAKELDKTLEQAVDVPTDDFDEILSKLDLTKSKLGEIVKITKQGYAGEDGKFIESFVLKDKNGSSETYGASSNTEKGQLLRYNYIEKNTEAINKQKNAEKEHQAQKDAFHKKNLNAIDMEIKKREEESSTYAKTLKSQMEERYSAISSMEKSLDNYNSKLEKFSVKPDDGHRYPVYQQQIDNLTKKISELDTLKNNLSKKDIIDESDMKSVNALQQEIDKLILKMNNMSAGEKGFDPLGADKALEKINSELKKNSAMSKEAKRQIQGFYDEIRSGNPSKPIKDLLDDMYKLIQAERLAGREGKSFMDIFKEKVVYGAAANMAGMIGIYDIINVGREGITVIRELDTALTEMRKVSDETVSSLEKFQDVSFDLADDVGTTAKQIQNSTADYMRLGEALDEASESARVANILLNVSEFDNIDDATSSLVSMGQAYKDLEKIEIVDKLNEVGEQILPKHTVMYGKIIFL